MSQPTSDPSAIKLAATDGGCCGASSGGCCSDASTELTLHGAEAIPLPEQSVDVIISNCFAVSDIVFAGALAMNEYRSLLEAAGFERVELEVTSCAISATRPV